MTEHQNARLQSRPWAWRLPQSPRAPQYRGLLRTASSQCGPSLTRASMRPRAVDRAISPATTSTATAATSAMSTSMAHVMAAATTAHMMPATAATVMTHVTTAALVMTNVVTAPLVMTNYADKTGCYCVRSALGHQRTFHTLI
jgi:hypothetical protein